MSFNNKKFKSYRNTKCPTKGQVKTYKRKMRQWIDDDKSLYIRKNFAYNLTRYSNLGLIKADKFRKNLEISNNQSIRRERKIIATIMRIFVTESIKLMVYLMMLICVLLFIN